MFIAKHQCFLCSLPIISVLLCLLFCPLDVIKKLIMTPLWSTFAPLPFSGRYVFFSFPKILYEKIIVDNSKLSVYFSVFQILPFGGGEEVEHGCEQSQLSVMKKYIFMAIYQCFSISYPLEVVKKLSMVVTPSMVRAGTAFHSNQNVRKEEDTKIIPEIMSVYKEY